MVRSRQRLTVSGCEPIAFAVERTDAPSASRNSALACTTCDAAGDGDDSRRSEVVERLARSTSACTSCVLVWVASEKCRHWVLWARVFWLVRGGSDVTSPV